MRVLILSTGVPFPPANGGLLRTYHLARALAVHHEVTLVCFSFEKSHEPPYPVRVIEVPWEYPRLYQEMTGEDESIAARAAEILKTEISEPWFASFYGSPAMEEVIRREAPKTDLVIFEGSDTAGYMSVVPKSVPMVLDFMDVYSSMFRRDVDRMRPGSKERADGEKELQRIIQFEKEISSRCVLNLVCSELEAQHARKLLGVSHIEIYPNGVDTAFFKPCDERPEPDSFLFIGTLNYPPNIEAAHYFAREIFPLIRKEIPRAQFHIVGSRPVKSVQELGKLPGVVFHGRVEDVRPYYRQTAVSVIPILSGGGTRLKILEGAALGKAMVSTTIGAEGLKMHHGSELLIADTPEDFARAAIELAKNPQKRLELGERARKASLEYDWEKIEAKLCLSFDHLTSPQISQNGKTGNPLVSIIVNNFNYGRFVGEAIESALGQTYPNIEVIVVDDGSTDDSHEVIDRYRDRIKPVFKENGGQGSAFNVGFAASRGEYVIFLDADDLLFPHAVTEVLAIFQKDNPLKIHWPLLVIDEKGMPTGRRLPPDKITEGDFREVSVLEGPFYDSYTLPPASGSLWKRSFFHKILPMPEGPYRLGADTYLHTLSAVYGRMQAIKEPLSCYRAHGQNLYYQRKLDEVKIASLFDRIKGNFSALREHLNRLGVIADEEKWKQTNWKYLWLERLVRAKNTLSKIVPVGESFLLIDDGDLGGGGN